MGIEKVKLSVADCRHYAGLGSCKDKPPEVKRVGVFCRVLRRVSCFFRRG